VSKNVFGLAGAWRAFASWQKPWRRSVVLLLSGLCAGILLARVCLAQNVTVPADLQAELLSKVSTYDRNFQPRAGGLVRVLIVVQRGTPRSERSGALFKGALSGLDRLGGLPHEEEIVHYDSAAALGRRCRAERVSIVYVTPGLDGEITQLRVAFSGLDVLTVSEVADYVPAGLVLGFELLSGKPKMVLNLEQAKLQNVHFDPSVLRLMRVVQR
jgi:hypothetical protein